MPEKFEVKESIIEGKGIFATQLIPKGETICIFQGEVVSIPELKRRYATGEERIDDPFQIEYDLYIDLQEPYVFFNHSCEPNAGMKGRGELFALRDIAAGEEITFDYSTTEWTDDEAWEIPWKDLWRIPCTCGSKHCRKEVRVFSLLPKETQQQYYDRGALMDFIRDRYVKGLR